MPTSPNAERLVIVPGAEESHLSERLVPAAAEPAVCSFCFGTGVEVVAGKGARRCRCRALDARAKLLEAASTPRRYTECSLSNYRPAKDNNGSQLRAFNYAFRLVREYPAVDRDLLLMGSGVGVGEIHPSNYPCRADSCALCDCHGH